MNTADREADVTRAASGDRDALQRLLVQYHVALRSYVAGRIDADLRHRIDAEDVLQLAYVSAFGAVDRCQFSGPAAFYRWLQSIVTSRLRDEQRALRSQKRAVHRERSHESAKTTYPQLAERLADGGNTPSQFAAKDEATAAVMSSLARLTEDQREVIRLRFLEGWPVTEVAARMGKTEAAVHALCHRGLKSLREVMGSITQFLTKL